MSLNLNRYIHSKKSLFIDVGATSIKINQLNMTIPTPKNCTPKRLLHLLKKINIPAKYHYIFVGFPGIVVDGRTINAPNLNSSSWRNFDLEKHLRLIFNRKCHVLNDADLHGLRVIKSKGVELVMALGTGVGSALFLDGRLIPNLELGHAPFMDNKSYEDILGLKSYKLLGHDVWEKNLAQAIKIWAALFSPNEIYITGGLSKAITDKKIKQAYKIMGNP